MKYLAGGGASGASVKLRTLFSPRHVSFDQHEDFLFANGWVKEGITSRGEQQYSDEEEAGEAEEASPRIKKRSKFSEARTSELTLDMSGAVRTAIIDLPKSAVPQDIQAEMEFRDPSGEVQTVSSRIPLWPSSMLIGLKPDSWVASKDSFKFHVLVVDLV